MRHEYINDAPVTIAAAVPNSIRSTIEVSGVVSPIRDVNVSVNVEHSWTNDLRIELEGPDGSRVVLVEREGGSGDNFHNTLFDDTATRSITDGNPPFAGTFKPEQSLSLFDNHDANGSWHLHIEDMAHEDGGRLVSWSLSIDDGDVRLENTDPVTIDAGAANTVTSVIHAAGMGGVVVDQLRVFVDISHTWNDDLSIRLRAPDGTEILLVDRKGGREDDFRNTVFDDAAATAIEQGSAPFTGSYRPQQALAALQESIVQGDWVLTIQDHAPQDGGTLHKWGMDIVTRAAVPRLDTGFRVDVEFAGGLTPSQRSVFQLAAARWAEVIVGDLPDAQLGGQTIDDVVVVAEGQHIDGPSGVLGQAGPTHLRPGTLLPARGIMSFDSADLDSMEQDGSLVDVIVHEMGHVFGIGTLWEDMKLLEGVGTDDPVFKGPAAMQAYAELRGVAVGDPVPVANTGGPGTREGHWRESTFGNELMTGFLNAGVNPLSRLTIAALQDMGYQVNVDAADAFNMPSSMGLRALRNAPRHVCRTVAPKPEILPE